VDRRAIQLRRDPTLILPLRGEETVSHVPGVGEHQQGLDAASAASKARLRVWLRI